MEFVLNWGGGGGERLHTGFMYLGGKGFSYGGCAYQIQQLHMFGFVLFPSD